MAEDEEENSSSSPDAEHEEATADEEMTGERQAQPPLSPSHPADPEEEAPVDLEVAADAPEGFVTATTTTTTAPATTSSDEAPATVAVTTTAGVASKRGRGGGGGSKSSSSSAASVSAASESILDAVTQASLAQASALLSSQGYPAVASLLSTKEEVLTQQLLNTANTTTTILETTATKLVTDAPPWIHWNRGDMAPQLKLDSNRLQVTGPLRGYRMARASHGVSSGVWYYECLLLDQPTAKEILAQLPPQARLGPGLEARLQEQAREEAAMALDNNGTSNSRKRKHGVGGHVRLGWSMRTGDLQAPVGYDKWSYSIRDILGSIVHKSQRQDQWGGEGEGFGPGDVMGCGIYLEPDHPHIRFFKNGECLGNFVISKGKRVGGVAFSIEPGTYYPAVSLYMGAAVRVNFGPHWIYPPRKLPSGFPKFQPMSNLVPPPKSPSEAVALPSCDKALKVLRKPEHQQAVRTAIETEAKVQCEAYDKYWKVQVEFVKREREERGLTTSDLKAALQQQ